MGKGRRCEAPTRPLEQTRTSKWFSRNGIMVIFFSVTLKDLFRLGRSYPWLKPSSCPRCTGCRLWGHGFVSAYFDDYDQPFFLKRYRCPDCRCVIRMRPEGYFKGFQASVSVIRSSIVSKVRTNKWLFGISRGRQRHWFRALCQRIKAYLTDTWHQGVVAGFDYLLQLGQTPVSRTI